MVGKAGAFADAPVFLCFGVDQSFGKIFRRLFRGFGFAVVLVKRYRVEDVTRFCLEPYAVYGGFVYSFKCPSVSGDRIYDIALLDRILMFGGSNNVRIGNDVEGPAR